MTLTQQEIDEIDQTIDDLLATLGETHGFVQLIRDLNSKTYDLHERFTRQRQLAVNTLYSSVKEELEFYTGLTADREVEIAIELLTTSIQCLDAEKFIADSLPEQDGYDSYSS